jgi:predicted AlkP superfamily phosphohydrolase/phosphomutase
MPAEHYGPQTAAGLARLRSDLLAASRQMGTLSASLLAREAWDLFLAVLGTPHRAGHYLWDLSQVDLSALPADLQQRLEHALVDVYRACDDALAELLARVPRDATILVFALHGMGRNPGWSDHCAEILARILAADGGAAPKATFVSGVDRILPRGLIRPITNRLPERLQNALVTRWYGGMVDPRTTRCFPLLMDLAGYLRINLKGRESAGIVEAGREYEELCRALATAFLGLRDIRTGAPIVERVYHVDELAPRDAPYRDALPDLVVTWTDVSAIDSPGVRSVEVGELRWQPVGRLPSGRSGNHRGKGWFVAVGDGIEPGTRADGHRIVDLAPTVVHWLGAEQPPDFQGEPIPALCGRPSAV